MPLQRRIRITLLRPLYTKIQVHVPPKTSDHAAAQIALDALLRGGCDFDWDSGPTVIDKIEVAYDPDAPEKPR